MEEGVEDEFDEQDWDYFDENYWEIEGSRLREDVVEKSIDRLYVMLGSIKAGNTSSKLRKAVVSLLAKLVRQRVINNFLAQNYEGLYKTTFSLLIDCQLVKLQRDRANQKPHDFRVSFNQQIVLDPTKNYSAA